MNIHNSIPELPSRTAINRGDPSRRAFGLFQRPGAREGTFEVAEEQRKMRRPTWMPQNMQRSWKHHSSTGRTCGKSMKIMQFFLVLKMISAGFYWSNCSVGTPIGIKLGLKKLPDPIPSLQHMNVMFTTNKNERRRWRSKNGSFSCLFFPFNQSIDIWRKSSEVVGGLEHVFWLSIYWECHHPNWLIIMFYFPQLEMSSSQLTHIFQRGRFLKTTNQYFPVICRCHFEALDQAGSGRWTAVTEPRIESNCSMGRRSPPFESPI